MIETLSRWSEDRFVRRPGDKRFEYPALPQFGLSRHDRRVMSVDPYWIVEAAFGEVGTAPTGSVSFGHCRSLEEAQAQLAAVREEPENARYTDWVIVEYKPVIVAHVVHREPVGEERNP